jgi:hypothetical protein
LLCDFDPNETLIVCTPSPTSIGPGVGAFSAQRSPSTVISAPTEGLVPTLVTRRHRDCRFRHPCVRLSNPAATVCRSLPNRSATRCSGRDNLSANLVPTTSTHRAYPRRCAAQSSRRRSGRASPSRKFLAGAQFRVLTTRAPSRNFRSTSLRPAASPRARRIHAHAFRSPI